MKDIIFTTLSAGLLGFAYFCLCRYNHYKQIATEHYRSIDQRYGLHREKQGGISGVLRCVVIFASFALIFFLVKAGLEVLIYGKC